MTTLNYIKLGFILADSDAECVEILSFLFVFFAIMFYFILFIFVIVLEIVFNNQKLAF